MCEEKPTKSKQCPVSEPCIPRMLREEINELPIRAWEGKTRVVDTIADAESVARVLSGETLLGFDTETRPAFRKGESYPVSVLQLATEDEAYVILLDKVGLPSGLRKILSNPNCLKAGVALRRDVSDLQALAPFEAAGFMELATPAKAAGVQNLGLRGLCAVLLGFRIGKGAQRSNWAARPLTRSQVRYAATDAWAGRLLALEMRRRGWV